MQSENESVSVPAAGSAPTSFPHYPAPQANIPQGIPHAGPKDHKPLYKMMKTLLKPKVRTPKVKQHSWKSKKKYY